MKYSILVTGGAGFIGSHLVDALVKEGHNVRILDNIEPQVHGDKKPEYLNTNAQIIVGDVGDQSVLQKALDGIEIVFHQAALVGVGQSMYQVRRYMQQNTMSTASLFDFIVQHRGKIRKVIVASSMSTYGEGLYECGTCGKISPPLRSEEQLKAKQFELQCPKCNRPLRPLPTPEGKVQEITSVYALSKKDQEDLAMTVGKAYGIPTVALRYFNVYGTRQSLSNPYTGVCAIFTSRLKNGNPPLIFEDGLQSRDFVHVSDVVQANLLAMQSKAADYEVFNVGSGKVRNVLEIAQAISRALKKDTKPIINNEFRKGDVRHCFADITKIKARLGYKPSVSFEDGTKELIAWSDNQHAIDNVNKARQELERAGLVIR